jgi:hypothetical protein
MEHAQHGLVADLPDVHGQNCPDPTCLRKMKCGKKKFFLFTKRKIFILRFTSLCNNFRLYSHASHEAWYRVRCESKTGERHHDGKLDASHFEAVVYERDLKKVFLCLEIFKWRTSGMNIIKFINIKSPRRRKLTWLKTKFFSATWCVEETSS